MIFILILIFGDKDKCLQRNINSRKEIGKSYKYDESEKAFSAKPFLVTFIINPVNFFLVQDILVRKGKNRSTLSQRLILTYRLWSAGEWKLPLFDSFQLLQRKLRNWGLNLFGALSSLQKLFQLYLSELVPFNMLLKNRIVISQTHLPVVNDVIVYYIIFVSVFLDNYVWTLLHKRRPFFIDQSFHLGCLIFPVILVLSVSINVSSFFSRLNLLMLWQFW